jgi:hypothetical protein
VKFLSHSVTLPKGEERRSRLAILCDQLGGSAGRPAEPMDIRHLALQR